MGRRGRPPRDRPAARRGGRARRGVRAPPREARDLSRDEPPTSPVDVSASFPVGDDNASSTVARRGLGDDVHGVARHVHDVAHHGDDRGDRQVPGGKSQGGASSARRRKKKSSRASRSAANAIRLSSRERRVLASTEVEHLEKQHALERVADEKLDALRASLEETNARSASAAKALGFERDVVASARSTGATGAETDPSVSSSSSFVPSVSAEKWSRHVESVTSAKKRRSSSSR